MPKKELVISAKFDTSDFDKSVESMQKKLREIYAPSDAIRMQRTSQGLSQAGYGPLAGAPGQGDVQGKMNEYKRNMDKFIREEKTALEGKVKVLSQQEASYKKISEQYQKLINSGKEDLKLKEQLKAAQEGLNKAKQEEYDSEIRINALLKEKQRLSFGGQLSAAYQQGGIGGAAGSMMGMSPAMARLMMGATGGAVALGGQLMNDYAQRPIGLLSAQGAGMAGTAGRTLGQMQSGEFAFEGMFGEERQRAGGKARESVDRASFMDGLKALSGIGLLFSERARAQIFDPQKYSAMQSQQYAQDFGTALGAEKEMSPMKKDAIERIQKNIYKDIAAQRQMGQGDQEYFGANGFLQKAISAGFMEDMARESAKGIAAAGGSTAMQREAVVALRAERSLNLTNASGMLGSLSGAMGSAETSKQSLIDIFATAQQIGLDRSKYAEENRRFMQNVAEVVSRGSMTSEAGAQNVAGQMGAFATGTTTMRGIEDARAAYEAYSQATTATSGYTGAINAAVMMRQFPDLVKGAAKDPAVMQQMMSMTPEQMDPNSPFFKSLLSNYNKENPDQQKSAEQLMERVQQLHTAQSERYAPGLSEEPKKIAADMINYMKKGGNLADYSMSSGGEAEQGFAAYTSRLKMLPQYANLTPKQLERVAMGQAEQEAQGMPGGEGFRSQIQSTIKTQKDQATKDMEGVGGRSLDTIIATSAEGAGTSLRTLAKTIDQLADSAARAQAKMTSQEPAMRAAGDVYEKTSKTGFMEGLLGMDAEAAEGARKVQQNIAAGRDPYEGVPILEKWAYNRAKNQPHAGTGGK